MVPRRCPGPNERIARPTSGVMPDSRKSPIGDRAISPLVVHGSRASTATCSAPPRAWRSGTGTSTARLTSDRYSQLLPSLDERLREGLESTYRTTAAGPAAGRRRDGPLPDSRQDRLTPVLTCPSVWSGRRDSNPRPPPWQGCPRRTEPSRLVRSWPVHSKWRSRRSMMRSGDTDR